MLLMQSNDAQYSLMASPLLTTMMDLELRMHHGVEDPRLENDSLALACGHDGYGLQWLPCVAHGDRCETGPRRQVCDGGDRCACQGGPNEGGTGGCVCAGSGDAAEEDAIRRYHVDDLDAKPSQV